MSNARKLLVIAQTDTTFERADHRGIAVWVGKCLFCNTALVIGADGAAISRATVEHIRPRSDGGTDDLLNLAVACARCNQQKGARWDTKPHDPRAREIVEDLLAKRKKRWRNPDDLPG